MFFEHGITTCGCCFIFVSDRRWKANKINALYQWYCKENHLGDSSFGCLLNSCQFMKPSHATTLVWKMAGTLLMSFLLGTLNILLADLPSIKIIFSEECLWSLLFFSATEVVMKVWKILIDRLGESWFVNLTSAMPVQCSTSWAIGPTACWSLCGLITSP